MNEKVKRLRQQNEETRAILAAAFPLTFKGKGEPKLPLKIGIAKDIKALGSDISGVRLSRALHDYTSGPLYLKAMIAGAPRFDLDGYTAGFVTEEEAAHAAKRLHMINVAKARRIRAAGKAAKVRRESERALESVAA